MSDRIEIEECIVSKMAAVGTLVSRGDLTKENPLLVMPFGETNVVFHLATYERFNGAYVLSIDLTLGTFVRSDALRRQLWKMTEWLPFCSVRYENINDDQWEVCFTHSLLVDDNLSTEQIAQAMGSIVHTFQQARPMIEELVLQNASEEKVDTQDMYEEDSPTKFSAHFSTTSRTIAPSHSSRSGVLKALNNLVGLAPVKTVVQQLVARQEMEKLRARAGMKRVPPSPHLVFTGNPGTGKTTVAKLIGELYLSLGILKKGHVIEVNRSGLVAAYIGQTALKTRAVCEQALGGVLFIDEAYSLLGEGMDFGAEAIEELLTFMEAHRGEFVVVAAGYPEKMEALLASNPGLRSRFDTVLHFPDFDDAELLMIFEKLVAENDYVLRGSAVDAAKFLIKNMKRDGSFGNGREMRRLFHDVLNVHAIRLSKYSRPSTTMLNHLSGLDFSPMVKAERQRRGERGDNGKRHNHSNGSRNFAYGGYL